MVSTVKKGANRASAAAKRTKHAQRTPLPAKPPKPGDEPKVVTPTANSVSYAKAKALAEHAESLGWDTELIAGDGDITMLRATRGDEVITAKYDGSRYIYDDTSMHAYGSVRSRLRNASAARAQMAVKPEEAAAEAAKAKVKAPTKRNTQEDEDELTDSERKALLPFNPDTSTDDEVIAALLGRTIVWRNRTTGLNEEATLMPSLPQRHLAIVWKHNRRVLNFNEATSVDEQLQGVTSGVFRSVYVDAIRRVI